jgi:pyridoxine 4-dehydrogenase
MKAALDAGCNYWNGGEFYGPPDYNSLVLLRKYFARYPEDAARVVVNIKGGVRTEGGIRPDGSAAFLRQNVESCLRTLGPVGTIDEFELARIDPSVPYEESVQTLAELVAAGRIGGVACSEVSAATLRKAAAVTGITSVEIELSLWHTEPLTNGLAAACAELDIPLLAYGKSAGESDYTLLLLPFSCVPSPFGRVSLTWRLKRLSSPWKRLPHGQTGVPRRHS